MNELGYTIGSLIKGVNGERIARRGLKLISCDEGIRILYNVQLEDEDVRTEYDAIVIAPYGLFVVEVKNWNGSMTISPNGLLMRNDESGIVYDIPGRMSVKEALLRKHLRELFLLITTPCSCSPISKQRSKTIITKLQLSKAKGFLMKSNPMRKAAAI